MLALLLAAAAPALAAAVGANLRKGVVCDSFEVCKCSTTWDEESAMCGTGTCTYTKSAPSLCCSEGGWLCDSPDCVKPKTWEDCEWANFNSDGYDVPGEGLYVELPRLQAKDAAAGFVVLSDVDDTMKCSGGPPGGADKACLGTQAHELYPGVAVFSLALARGTLDDQNPRSVIPLSARPTELKAVLAMKGDSKENHAYQAAALRAGLGATWGLDVDNAQYGSLFDLSDFSDLIGSFDTDLTRYDKLGHRKYVNWKAITGTFGKASVFVGDNGQGDVVAAQMMLMRSAGMSGQQGALQGAFIHDVLGRCATSECRSAWAGNGVHFFGSYPEAAGIALREGFISEASCRAVCDAAPSLECSCGGDQVSGSRHGEEDEEEED